MQVEIEALPFCTILCPYLQVDDKVQRDDDGRIIQRQLYCMNMDLCRQATEKLIENFEAAFIGDELKGDEENDERPDGA